MTTTNVLITGCKSGIGLGLLKKYASRPDTTVIAAIRDSTDSENAKAMVSATTTARGSTVIPVQYDASTSNAASDMLTYLQTAQPQIKHLDIVIANAGITGTCGRANEITAESAREVFAVNALAPALLFKSTRDLLVEAPNPKFFAISSSVGSITLASQEVLQLPEYGMSKAALNWYVATANKEEEKITVIAVHPGLVATAMGNPVAEKLGIGKAPTTIDESASALLGLFDSTTKEIGGMFRNVISKPEILPW